MSAADLCNVKADLTVFQLRVLSFPGQTSSKYSAFHSAPHSAVTGPVEIHYDFPSDPTVKQGGQSDRTVSV
jgi:hypothetical protein